MPQSFKAGRAESGLFAGTCHGADLQCLIPQTMPVIEQQKTFESKIGQLHPFRFRQAMMLRQRQYERFLKQEFCMQGIVVNWQCQHTRIKLAIVKFF